MNRRSSLIFLVLIATGFVVGLAWLFRLRLSGGDVYPTYSSLRADPLGTRAFYEALVDQPELHVTRWLKPLHLVAPDAQTFILAGMTREAWQDLSTQDAQALDDAAIAGARVVVVFAAELEPEVPATPSKFEIAEKERSEKEKAKRISELPDRLRPADWSTRWNVTLGRRRILDRDLGAMRRTAAPTTLPLHVPWKSDLYFKVPTPDPWTAIYTRGNSPVVLERLRGKGSIVLATDAFFLSNEAMTDRRFPSLLTWLIGPNRTITFVESHLGLAEEVGIATLARRYGLAGSFFVLVFAFALWVWKRMALFVPPSPTAEQLSLTYHQTAGLEALLRRAVPPKQLLATCVAEWKAGSRQTEASRVEAAAAQLPSDASPAAAYNAIVRALKTRV